MEMIVGTAGHIDHGKTALVKALTGIDADRLPEEKRRGITVDLGFAELRIGDRHLGFVDVPGHEGFVKNMLAGASGIDVVMLVIEAAEGVMPQTREHFEICRLLGVNSGVIVLTKTDIADQETIELAKLDAAELVAGSFLEHAPVICVSAKTGEGIDALKQALCEIADNLPGRDDRYVTRLPIDRSFSMKGFGAVATGTLVSGTIVEGSELQLFPSAARVRIRGIQTHGQSVRSVSAGQRTAVNLGGIDHSKVARGMTAAEPDALVPTSIFDAEIEVLADAGKVLRSRNRVRVHIGTAEVLARVQVLNDRDEIAPAAADLVQVRLESPVIAVPGDRFIIRRYSPQATIAGGEVIDVSASKHRRREFAGVRQYISSLLEAKQDDAERIRIFVSAAGARGINERDLQNRTGLRADVLKRAVDANVSNRSVVKAGGQLVVAAAFQSLTESTLTEIGAFHKREPLARGITRETLSDAVSAYLARENFDAVIDALEAEGKISVEKDTVRLSTFETSLTGDQATVSDRILARYQRSALAVPSVGEVLSEAVAGTQITERDARRFLRLHLDSGSVVKVTDDLYFAKSAVDDLTMRLRKFAAAGDRLIDVPSFKSLAAVSRKYAIPLLEYFDREHITVRRGDKRYIV